MTETNQFPQKSRSAIGCIVLLALLLAAPAPLVAGGAGEAGEAPEKTFRIDAENWRWVPNQIRVVQGTRVTLEIKSFDATHRFDLKAYGLKVVLPQDATTAVEFVADKAGKFTWKCGRPCGNGCPKMRGTLFVVDPDSGD